MKKLNQLLCLVILCGSFLSFSFNAYSQCFAGDLQTTGTIDVAGDDSFDLSVINQMPPADPGGFGWYLDNTNTNGTGGLNGPVIIFNQTGTEVYDRDAMGILTNANLPLLSGTWVVKGAVYTDVADAFDSICDFTTDSLIVNFDIIQIPCSAGIMQTTGETTVCKGDSFVLETMNDTIPQGGGLGWLFQNSATGGTGGTGMDVFIFSAQSSETFDEDLGGILSFNMLPILEDTWVAKAAAYTNSSDPNGSICSISEDSIILKFNPEITATLDNPNNTAVTAIASGGTMPYTYAWSNGEIGDTAMNLSDGLLTVEITDSLGCTFENSIDLSNTSIDEIDGLLDFELSPNPTSDFSYLDLRLDRKQHLLIQLMSINGQLIDVVADEQSEGGLYEFNLTQLNSGVYLIHITTETGQFANRIVKR